MSPSVVEFRDDRNRFHTGRGDIISRIRFENYEIFGVPELW
ncbi:MAG: hypothetical protein V7K40_28545 [Nostoc sp.]